MLRGEKTSWLPIAPRALLPALAAGKRAARGRGARQLIKLSFHRSGQRPPFTVYPSLPRPQLDLRFSLFCEASIVMSPFPLFTF